MNSKSKQHSFFTVFVCGHKDTTIFEIQKIIIILEDFYNHFISKQF